MSNQAWRCGRIVRRAVLLVALLLIVGPQGAEGRPRNRRVAAPTTGSLDVASTTTGAQLFIDGAAVATLPLAQPLVLPAGQHTVKLTKDGYTQYLDVVVVAPGEVAQLAIDLLPVAGVLAVKANVADARVFVDGRFVGFAPLEAEIDVGPRTIRVAKAGYRDFIVARRAVAGQRLTLEAGLDQLAAGTTPYRPLATRPKWYERWYVWAGAAGGVAAVTVAVLVPVLAAAKDPVDGFRSDYRWTVP